MLDLSDQNLSRFVQAMEKLGYVPRVPVAGGDFALEEKRAEWMKEKGAVVFTFIDPKNSFKHIDVFLNNPLDFEDAYPNRETVEVGQMKINLISIDDLIKIKLLAGRPRDLEDANQLRRIKEMREKGNLK